jgi:glycosyltransferase involved in cell wall biosynthesis
MEANDVKISYLITTHNETESLKLLLAQLNTGLSLWDEIVIVDDYSDNTITTDILTAIHNENNPNKRVYQHRLNNDFASQKNFGISQCKNDYIFQIDADELLDSNLLSKYKEIVQINPTVDLFLLPRINKVEGITISHVTNWKWQISKLDSEIQEQVFLPQSGEYMLLKFFGLIISEESGRVKHYTPIINWPDYQTRLYRRSENIQWQGRVHERIIGHNTYSLFPMTKKFSLYHYKEIEKQEQQNELYSRIGR